jgi:hypothetical protein
LITRALAGGADGVALQCLPYWWQAQYRQFQQYYGPQSANWPALWNYDALLKRLFRGPQSYENIRPPWSRSSDLLVQRDAVAEPFEGPDMPTLQRVAVVLDKVVGSGLLIGRPAVQ